jgi:DNA-binding response OmpR family regulator
MNILLVEDESALAESVISYLSKEQFHCEWADTFDKAQEKINLYDYDCALVDIMLPDGNGLKIIEELKKINSSTGVIVISAKNSIDDKIKGLDLGADDYLNKPFDLSELNARIKAVIRRRNFQGKNSMVFGDISISPYEHEVEVNGQKLDLTRKEFDLLLYFVSNPNRVITKESIAEHLWGDHMDELDSFDFLYAHLKNLRKKIEKKGGRDSISTVYGVGYKFNSI